MNNTMKCPYCDKILNKDNEKDLLHLVKEIKKANPETIKLLGK